MLDDAQIRAREQQSEAMVRQAEAHLRLSQHQVTVLGEQLRQSEIGVGQARADAQGRVNEAEARLAAAEAQLAQAVAAHAQAKWERDAYTRLVREGATSRSRTRCRSRAPRRRQAAVVAANRRQVEAARGAVTTAKANLDNPAIRSSQVAAIQAQILQAQADIAAAQADAERARAAARRGAREPERPAGDRAVHGHGRHAHGRAGRGGHAGHADRHPREPGPGLPARVRAGGRDRARARGPARARLPRLGADARPIDATVSAHRSRGVVHAREHVLPRGPREAGRRRQAAAPAARSGFAKPGMPADGEILVDGASGPRARRGDERRRPIRRAGRDLRRSGSAGSPSATAPSRRCGASTSTCRPGEIFGLIGPDGAGKTSTFQILGGVMEATAGHRGAAGPARAARRGRTSATSRRPSACIRT